MLMLVIAGEFEGEVRVGPLVRVKPWKAGSRLADSLSDLDDVDRLLSE